METRTSGKTCTRAAASTRPRRLRSSLAAAIALALPLVGFGAAPADPQTEPSVAPGRLLIAPRAGLPAAEFERILKPHGGKSVRRITGTDIQIVELPPNVSEKTVAKLLA